MHTNLRVNTQTPATQDLGTSTTVQQPAPTSRGPSPSPLGENLSPRPNANASPTSERPRLSLQELTGRTSPTTQPVTQPTTQPTPQPASPQAAPTSTTSVAPASPTATTAPPPAKLVVDEPKGGNDKQWFPDPSGAMGWLQARDNGKVDAVKREVATIKELAKLQFPVAQIIDRPAPESITSNGANKPVQATGGGVWLATVDSVATKKPKALGHPMAGSMQTNKLVKELRGAEVNLPTLALNLADLLRPVDPQKPEFTRADQLCQHVGEVDIAFTKDGRITLLDVAPADGGQVAAQDDQGVAHIKAGLQNLLAAVNKAAAAQAATLS